MNPTVAQLILHDRRLAYAITDQDLILLEVGGVSEILAPDGSSLGRSLLDLVPELIGSEPELDRVLRGQRPSFSLPAVNRDAPDGSTVYLSFVELPYRSPDGQITGLLHLVQDVTEMGRLQQRLVQHRNELHLLQTRLAAQNLELAAANTELRRLDELKSTFVSVAAHELRAPLASVSGYVELLQDEDFGALNAEQREYLDIIQRASKRLLGIINDLLDVTRIEAGRLELELQPAHLPGLVEGIVAEFRPLLHAKRQQLTVHTATRLPPALIDETRAAQILGNLLSNAVKYTPDDGLITLRIDPDDAEGFLRVQVQDNGVGIPPEDQARLFARFFRAGTAHLTGATGAGLGLHITRSLVELHGGRIWFESEVGVGTSFYVTFPVAGFPTID